MRSIQTTCRSLGLLFLLSQLTRTASMSEAGIATEPITTATTTTTTIREQFWPASVSSILQYGSMSTSTQPTITTNNNIEQQEQTQQVSMDAQLAQLIKLRLMPELSDNFSAQLSKTETISGHIGKLYKLLKFAAKASDKLQPTLERRTETHHSMMQSLPPVESRNLATQQQQTRTMQLPSRALARLAKKLDWNALIAKLAKVFLQYFLDLILSDMFGSTGELML